MDDVRGDLLVLPHGTIPAAVMAKNIKVWSFGNSKNIQKQTALVKSVLYFVSILAVCQFQDSSEMSGTE